MNVKVPHNNGSRVAFEIQKVLKAWEVYLNAASLGSWISFVEPYLSFDYKYGLLKKWQTRSKSCYLRSQWEHYRKEDSPHTDTSAVCSFVFNLEDGLVFKFLFLAAFMLTKLKSVIKNVQVFTLSQNS